MKIPEGHYIFGTVKVGERGQIVIPKEVRDMFSLKSGDSLVLMADKGQGIALQPFSHVESFWNAVNHVKKEDEEQK